MQFSSREVIVLRDVLVAVLVVASYTPYCHCVEGPEGVKWEVGSAYFVYFCTGKMGFGSLGLGITNTKLGMGNKSMHCTACVVNAR